ncbi:MAG: NYN domain-containing protein, partial [Gammaproteobacteria bacterium]
PRVYPSIDRKDARAVAKTFYTMVMGHAENSDLYRILFYDCAPAVYRSHHPITGNHVDFSKLDSATFRRDFHDELKRKRKVALRLGTLQTNKRWAIHPEQTRQLLRKNITVDDLEPQHVSFDLRQKGVDMKIGLDIAALVLKRLVTQIVLVTADADFVPAAKFARREGIDFILDPMWNHIDPSLHEHIDGLKSTSPNPHAT